MSSDNKTAIIIISIVAFACITCVLAYQGLSISKTKEETKQYELGVQQSHEKTQQMKYAWKCDSVNSTIPIDTTNENK